MDSSIEQHWMQRARVLTQVLIISGTLNIGFLSSFIYFILKEKESVVSFEPQKELVSNKIRYIFTNEEVLKAYFRASFQELVSVLENKDLVEDGYTKRDLALACLVEFHHFPLAKVLGEGLLQRRKVVCQQRKITVFPKLADEHFHAVLHFLRTEKWPLTSKGIFLTLQKKKPPYEPSLLEAFYVSSEFHHVQSLVQKSIPSLEKSALAEIFLSGSWNKFKEVEEKLRAEQTYDLETSRDLLLTYALECKSIIAAHSLLLHQGDYIMKRLNDAQLLTLFDLNIDVPEALSAMAKELLLSPRSDTVRQRAAVFLYSEAKEIMPQPYDHATVLRRFFPNKVPEVVIQSSPKAEPITMFRIHTVQERDSLWKIARKYGTSVEAIMQLNHLESDRLKLGKNLKIPNPPSS